MFPLIDFGTFNTKMATERRDWLQFPRKINKIKVKMP